MKILKVCVILSILVVLAGCATSSRDQLLATSEGQVQLRSIQSRAFDTTDRQRMLRIVIATMQDLGFVIDQADEILGSVSGTKLAGYAMRLSVTVRPRGKTQLLVRANVQYKLTQVVDPEPYQQFFAALSRALFLEANLVE